MRRLLLIAVALLLAHPAVAATAVVPTVEAMARESGAVVRATVIRQVSRWSAGGRRLVTDVELEVTERLRGAPPDRLLVTVPGGALYGVGQVVDGAPELADGDDVVLFLAQRPGEWRLVGLALGTFKVAGGQVLPGAARFMQVAGPVAVGEALAGPMSLAELRRRVGQAR